MIHECFRDGFVCSQAFHSDYLRLEAQFSFELAMPRVHWSAEVYSNVRFCPFCGFKAKNVEEMLDDPEAEEEFNGQPKNQNGDVQV